MVLRNKALLLILFGMKIVSFINEVDIIRKILEHLGLWEDKTPPERAPS